MTESEQHASSVPEPDDSERDMEVRYVKPGEEEASEPNAEWSEHDGVFYRPAPRPGEPRVVEGTAPDPVVGAQPTAKPAPDDDDVDWNNDRFGPIYPPAGGAMTGTVLPPAEPTEDA
jgi:hypothetical protein